MKILSEIRNDKDIMSKEYVKGLIYNPKKIVSDFKINNTSLINYTGLIKLLGEDTPFSGSSISFDYSYLDIDDEYKPSYLLGNIDANSDEPVTLSGFYNFNIQQEQLNLIYFLAISYGQALNTIISEYNVESNHILDSTGSVYSNTINNNNGYLYVIDFNDNGSISVNNIYILCNISTLNNYGALTLPVVENSVWISGHDTMPNDGDCIEPNKYIWKCLFINNADFGEGEVNLQTNTAYDAVNNKIATMSDVNKKESIFRYSTMPTPSSTWDSKIIQYTGYSYAGGNWLMGHFYVCTLVTDMQTSQSHWEWREINVQTVDLSNYLSKTNYTSYTPTGDYNPATKKYVDNKIARSSTQPTDSEAELWIEDSDIDGSGGGGSSIEVIDSLISTSTTDALSANQGRVLNGKITTIESDYLTSTNIKDNLTTDSATDALSAKQGKALNTRLAALEGDNLDSRLDTLEGQNLNSRISTIEGMDLVESTNISKIVMVTSYPSTPDPDTLYIKVASL